MLGPDPDLARRDGFIAALKERDVAVDAPRVSRWESGMHTLPNQVIATYERVLDLPEGGLTAVTDGLLRTFVHDQPSRRSPAREEPLLNHEIESLVDRAELGAATGAHWLRLGEELNRYDRVFLREREWAQLTHKLVNELGSAVGLAYVRRFEAAARFIRHPNARRHLVMAVGRFVTDPHTQVVAPVLNLLGEVPDPAAAELTLRMLTADSDNKYLRRAASSVAAVKLARGHFGPDALPRLESHVVGALRRGESLDGRLDSFDLAVRLPPESWERIEHALRTRRAHQLVVSARESDEMIAPARAASLVADLAPVVQADTATHQAQEPDLMLRRLLREALFHSHKPRRHHAALFIAASPYAPAAARHLLQLAGDANDLLAARAWTVLMRVGDGGRRDDVVGRACEEKRASVRARALVNVGIGGKLTPAQCQAVLHRLDTSRSLERHATMFAAGMAAVPELVDLATADELDIQYAAAWWLRQGGAIQDEDVVRRQRG